MRYRSNPLGHDCSWLITNLTVRLMFLFCCIIHQTICPDKETKCPENGQLHYVISSTVTHTHTHTHTPHIMSTCPCNFVWTKRQNVQKMANCFMLFRALLHTHTHTHTHTHHTLWAHVHAILSGQRGKMSRKWPIALCYFEHWLHTHTHTHTHTHHIMSTCQLVVWSIITRSLV